MTVALFSHDSALGHDTGPGHPESKARYAAVMQALAAAEFAGLVRQEAPLAPVEALYAAHEASHVDGVLAMAPLGAELLAVDADTMVSAGSREAALRAAGGAMAAVDTVISGDAKAAFVAMRPPGHHAERDRAMGFCLFNNAAVAALHARARWGLRRVAVVDFDVHHGNGTQDIFWNNAELFYASSHQHPCYPGTGMAHERGVAGNIVNAPLAPGTGSATFRAAWEAVILPALMAFEPELLIISAGFDAHVDDPLAQLRLEEADFAWVTEKLVAACPGRVVSLLEGGYDLAALGACVAVHVRGLMAN